jgi:hypothetical protein
LFPPALQHRKYKDRVSPRELLKDVLQQEEIVTLGRVAEHLFFGHTGD